MYSLSVMTPLGIFCMILDESEHVIAAGFEQAEAVARRAGIETPDKKLDSNHPYARAVLAYFDGDYAKLQDIPIRLSGTPFQQAAHLAMQSVQPGKTISYAHLAQSAGSPAAIRAIASSCRSNKIILLVPCHRIVRSDGHIGQYVHGQDIKRWLLAHEGVLPANR